MAGKKVFHLIAAPEESAPEPTMDSRSKKRRKNTNFSSMRPETNQDSDNSRSKSEKATMIVGVDFGTTYSGFATAMAKSSYNDVSVNNSWPKCGGYQDKVPSILSYDMKTPGKPKVTAWGYETKSSTDTYTWFKLGLGQDQIPDEFDDKLLFQGLGSIKRPENMTYSDFATDYLRHFYEHLLERIEIQVGSDTFDLLAFHFVLAVPAGWPDESRRAIQYCAENAGFAKRAGDKISLIAEPEAAALATFHAYSSKLASGTIFKNDTNVLIVDMGGGTVDLITYTIKQTKPFRVAEACVGSGAKCGSSTIDRHLHQMMEERFGDEYRGLSQKLIGPKSMFMNEFENAKRRFDDITETEVVPLNMDLESSEYYDAEDGNVILREADMVQLFRPVIENVTGLIGEQAERTKAENEFPISAVILCGGLAECKYIQSRLKEFCQRAVPEAQVLVPPNPWSAICRGAAMRETGSGNIIKSRRARRSYGTVLLEPFIEGEHKKKDTIKHPEMGIMVQKMFWHIKRNETLLPNERYRWLKNVDMYVGGRFGYEGVIEVYQSDNADAPTWKSSKGVKPLGQLPVDLSSLEKSSKRKNRMSTTYIPGTEKESESVKVEIGQVIRSSSTVEFVARVGSRTVGLAKFEYAPIAKAGGAADSEDEEDNPDYWLHQPFE